MDKRLTEDPRQKGDIAEKLFELECIKRDIEVFAPINSGSRIDYVILQNGEFKRVQIKYVSASDGKICASLIKKQNGRNLKLQYTDEEIDLLLVYCPDTDEWYDIPLDQTKWVALRITPPKNNQTKGVNLAKDFKWAFSSAG